MNSKRHPVHSHTRSAMILLLLLVAPGMIPSASAGEILLPREAARVAQPGTETTPPEGLTSDDWATMQDLIREAQYQFTWQVRDGVWAYRAPNRAHGLSLSLAADGFYAARYNAKGDLLWDFGLSLAAYGEQPLPAVIAEDNLIGSRERVEYHWSQDVVDWYTNSADGIEHGLTLAAPPARADGATVKLTFALRGSLTPELDASGQGLHLKDPNGETALIYDQLAVYDANGQSLPARMRLAGCGPDQQAANCKLQLIIDATGAAYPLTVDPLLHEEVVKLTASDGADDDYFGISVGISGDTAVVGAHAQDGVGDNSGAAYVFERNKDVSGTTAGNWGQVKKLTALFDAEANALFGAAVAISGDTIVVGAFWEDGAGANRGAAYVYNRNQDGADGWGLVATLIADDAEDGDRFGISVAISGDTAVVGASHEDGAGTGQGAAYVFERNKLGADKWGQVKKLTPLPQDSAHFGGSVAISGDIIVVGAHMSDDSVSEVDIGKAYVYGRNRSGADKWGWWATLLASDFASHDHFGTSVAISGETIVIGANGENGDGINRGAAYIFERNQGGLDVWGQVKKLTASDAENEDYFGVSVSISGDTLVVGADLEDGDGNARGAAYLFQRNQGGADNWGQVRKLAASDAQNGDRFGASVAISGDTIVVGAEWEGSQRGAAYVFVAAGGLWQEVAIPRASDAANKDHFGIAVAISGDTAVVGAEWEDGSARDSGDQGAAYVFERNKDGSGTMADNWGQVQKLAASNPEDDAFFGASVGISGDTIVVGEWGKDSAGGDDRGAAYIFERNWNGAENWGQVQWMTGAGADDFFGFSVAISGDTIVVGAWGEQSNVGAAYVFERNENGKDKWGQVERLTASVAANDNFGYSVSISGDTLVVGAYGEEGEGTDRGAAYVFERNQGGADMWGQVTELETLYPDNGDRFGIAVAISGDTAIVGADREDGFEDDLGAAYIFERNQGGADMWGQVAKLRASDAADNDYFGGSVSISGDTAVVGAHGDGSGFRPDLGAAYVFERNQGGTADLWGQVTKLTASDAAIADYFGRSVAISGNQIIVGADGKNVEGTDRGAAYVFRWGPLTAPEITVEPGSLAFGIRGVDAGKSPSKIVTITNIGDGDLHISGVSLTGAGAAEFVIGTDSGEDTLAPGGTRTVPISFNPSSEGAKSANLSIASDDADEATVDVPLSGNGVPGDVGSYVFLPMVVRDD